MSATSARRSGFGSVDSNPTSFRGLIGLVPDGGGGEDVHPKEHTGNEQDSSPNLRENEHTETHHEEDIEPSEGREERTSAGDDDTVVNAENPWLVSLPSRIPNRRSKAAFQDLLEGPLETVPVVLPEQIANALQEYTLQLAISGSSVSKQTIVGHALAFAYAHQNEWVDQIPGDGRRRGAKRELTSGARKTTFRLPEKLNKATLMLLLRTLPGREDNAASRLSLVATALAFSLNRAEQWVDQAIEQPVR